jgi:hypothetical protein
VPTSLELSLLVHRLRNLLRSLLYSEGRRIHSSSGYRLVHAGDCTTGDCTATILQRWLALCEDSVPGDLYHRWSPAGCDSKHASLTCYAGLFFDTAGLIRWLPEPCTVFPPFLGVLVAHGRPSLRLFCLCMSQTLHVLS